MHISYILLISNSLLSVCTILTSPFCTQFSSLTYFPLQRPSNILVDEENPVSTYIFLCSIVDLAQNKTIDYYSLVAVLLFTLFLHPLWKFAVKYKPKQWWEQNRRIEKPIEKLSENDIVFENPNNAHYIQCRIYSPFSSLFSLFCFICFVRHTKFVSLYMFRTCWYIIGRMAIHSNNMFMLTSSN